METLIQIKNKINQIVPDAITKIISLKNFDEPLLIVALVGSKNHILIYDKTNQMKEIAEIAYSKKSNNSFISIFEVNENYQQKGIGRFLFNLASAHCDIFGNTMLYGFANPTNNIKGVSNIKNVSFEVEKNAILEIYRKLGCTISNENRFTKKWNSGEIIENSNQLIQELAYQMAKKEGLSKPSQMQ